jgi:phage portal protein BeeE
MRIQTSGLERADTSSRYAAYKTAIDSGFLTVNEVRALEDRPPLEMTPTPEQAAAGAGPGQEGSAVL